MRIVIDMQGAQSASRFRGIGRYTQAFVRGVLRNAQQHDVFLVLNGLLPESIIDIRQGFSDVLPQQHILVWHAPGPVREGAAGNDGRRIAAELIREAFIQSLDPDVIHITSLFEGEVDEAVTSIGQFDTTTPVTTAFYDLIPALNPKEYLDVSPRFARFYRRKLEFLQRADRYFAISEFSAAEGSQYLQSRAERFINVSTAIDDHVQRRPVPESDSKALLERLDISKPFVLYTGGGDPRKNLPRLIAAYAQLPEEHRRLHQLVFVGRMPPVEVQKLWAAAKKEGLRDKELILTGYVSDQELVTLYNVCRLFVFPSWHEGFGIPALEAMQCGAPVIASNTSSLPEVIGLDEALFDPLDVADMTSVMLRGLTDDAFRKRLVDHGVQQARRFSWDVTARRAIAEWEALTATTLPSQTDYDSAWTPGVALIDALGRHAASTPHLQLRAMGNTMAENLLSSPTRHVLVDISEVALRDAATGVQRVVKGYLRELLLSPPKGFVVRPVYSTGDGQYHYARQFGRQLLGRAADGLPDEPMRWQRGDIFFALDMQHDVQLENRWFLEQLRLDGVSVQFMVYDLLPIQLPQCFQNRDVQHLHEHWLRMIGTFDGAICISKATADAYSEWLDDNLPAAKRNVAITFLRLGSGLSKVVNPAVPEAANNLKAALGDRVTFLSVSTLEPRKGQPQIFAAINELWRRGHDVNLVFVGRQGWGVDQLAKDIMVHPKLGTQLHWLQGIDDAYLDAVYQLSDCLIYASLNEGFGLPLVEAASFGKPLILRDIPVFREVAEDGAHYFEGHEPNDLANAVEAWLAAYAKDQHPKPGHIENPTFTESTRALHKLLVGPGYRPKQLLVDVSELVLQDAGTGIQRVVRNILREWLIKPPEGCHVEPVYASTTEGYRYARAFKRRLLDLPQHQKQKGKKQVNEDTPVEVAPGDCFAGLDLQPQVIPAQYGYYQWLRQQGVTVKFVVYDLLQVLMPQHFPHGAEPAFTHWLNAIAASDGAVCISKAVADELEQWIRSHHPAQLTHFDIGWFHLGADLDGTNTTHAHGRDSNSKVAVAAQPSASTATTQDKPKPRLLMVGTVEPRKGHGLVLDAFEQLWAQSSNAELVIVGKAGWMVDELTQRLTPHPEAGKRLHWRQCLTDAELEAEYQKADALIAASEGEGFGLPLVEAAQQGVPIIARDIPVFREVAGEHAFYFDGSSAEAVAKALQAWLELRSRNEEPKSQGLPVQSWADSAQQLSNALALTPKDRANG